MREEFKTKNDVKNFAIEYMHNYCLNFPDAKDRRLFSKEEILFDHFESTNKKKFNKDKDFIEKIVTNKDEKYKKIITDSSKNSIAIRNRLKNINKAMLATYGPNKDEFYWEILFKNRETKWGNKKKWPKTKEFPQKCISKVEDEKENFKINGSQEIILDDEFIEEKVEDTDDETSSSTTGDEFLDYIYDEPIKKKQKLSICSDEEDNTLRVEGTIYDEPIKQKLSISIDEDNNISSDEEDHETIKNKQKLSISSDEEDDEPRVEGYYNNDNEEEHDSKSI